MDRWSSAVSRSRGALSLSRVLGAQRETTTRRMWLLYYRPFAPCLWLPLLLLPAAMTGFKDGRFSKPSKQTQDEPSHHVYFAGIGHQMKTDRVALKCFLESRFGELCRASAGDEEDEGIYMPWDRRYCVASFKDLESAVKAHTYFASGGDLSDIGASRVMVKYARLAEEKPSKSTEPECTSTTEDVIVPGLTLIENFVTAEEEQLLMAELGNEDAPWRESLNRRVQHYGFIFNYKTIMIDYSKPSLPMPASCEQLAERIIGETSPLIGEESVIDLRDSEGHLPALNQLTINEYLPGQGIASHTDTETCFGALLYILSIGSGLVMNLTKNSSGSNLPQPNDCSKLDVEESEDESDGKRVRKYVFLPPRSLLVLSGDARYKWSHGINPRKFDKVDGELIPRQRRVSFTFRHVVKPGPIPSSQLTSGDIEQEHVVKVYDAIALHWNHTRGKRKVHWHRVKDFLAGLPPGTLLADVGSGDGKYFGVNPNVTTIGCDRSWNLLQVSREPGHETFCCDAVKLPLLSNAFDAVVCIAVLHHMATVDRRYAVISELVRIVRLGGEILIQAWALEQGTDSKRVFASQDTMVPWKLNKRFLLPDNKESAATSDSSSQSDLVVYERYCHVYKEGELEDLCSRVPGCRVVESGWDKGNWFVRIVKIEDERMQGAAASCGPESRLPALIPRQTK